MSMIENALALPLRRNLNPIKLGTGLAVTVTGAALAVSQLAALA